MICRPLICIYLDDRGLAESWWLDVEFSGEPTREAGEDPAGERADEDADNHVAEVMLADEGAADGYHECPEEHPITICLEPFGHARSWCLAVRLCEALGRCL